MIRDVDTSHYLTISDKVYGIAEKVSLILSLSFLQLISVGGGHYQKFHSALSRNCNEDFLQKKGIC